MVDDDKVLIECWMGAKWGFYKFPLDPARDAASLDEDPVWREAGRQVRVLGPDETTGSRPNLVALAFDLARPLKEQFEQARIALVDLQQRFKREGGVLETVSTMAPRWTLALRVLDAEDAGASPAAMKEILSLDGAGLDEIHAFAHRMRNGGYREILLLPQK